MTYLDRLFPLCIAALPLTAMAAPENLSDWQDQRGDPSSTWTISQLLGDDVIAGENTEVGEVTDVIFDDQGTIQSLVVYSNGNAVERGFRTVEWPVKVFEPSDVLLSIGQQPSEFGNQQVTHSPVEFFGQNQFSARTMLGMGVQVEGSPYAEIEDLVLNEQGQVTSAVIDPDGMETANYWLPTDIGWINEDWVMILPYSQSDIEQSDSYSD
ncbi:PRC-barrel domain-containing protein [Halomonas sp. TRM85114]|uniref:PRC-barrel domain-containing protein n=1 Tax=Halomonas jincaotanensis TaxID=2810616 RepID=UPI001BD3FF99|nr:PRC-barrel domain-containing protein [Halomonas jincaotanensis]MBS9405536.1 PRC-barrel domain-containing protein [Halomonas jincaotanensis]